MTFVRNIEAKLEDCTTPLQFREVLEKFKHYLYNGQISKVFQDRLGIISALRTSAFNSDIFDAIADELDNHVTENCNYSPNLDILKKSPKGRKKDKPLTPESILLVNVDIKSREGSLMEDTRYAIIKIALEKSLGKKKEACRILGIPMQELCDCIKVHDVKIHVRRVKQHVKSEVVKKKI